MSAVDPQITASELLRIFHRDEPYLLRRCFHNCRHSGGSILFSAPQGRFRRDLFCPVRIFVWTEAMGASRTAWSPGAPFPALRTAALWHRLSGPYSGVSVFQCS